VENPLENDSYFLKVKLKATQEEKKKKIGNHLNHWKQKTNAHRCGGLFKPVDYAARGQEKKRGRLKVTWLWEFGRAFGMLRETSENFKSCCSCW